MATRKRIETVVPFYDKVIEYNFYLLFFTVPLYFNILNTTSPFEFNKILLVYAFSAIIGGAWALKILKEKKIELLRTPLDIPIVLYLIVLVLSTLFSTYIPISLWGKGTMPMGALAPTLAMIFLYYAFVNHMKDRGKLFVSFYVILSSGAITSSYAILQHFGIDFIRWGEQFLSRSFGTIGQANGLAAFLGALAPLLIYFFFMMRHLMDRIISASLLFLFILSILFTASRSGLFAFIVTSIMTLCFIFFYFLRQRQLKEFLFLSAVLMAIGSLSWYASFITLSKTIPKTNIVSVLTPERIEHSAEARFLVWKGGIEIWQKHPLLGSGPETFGDQYNLVRTTQHNVTSGWNLLFTKAHNEYIHILATTGALGLLTYLILIIGFIGWTSYHLLSLLNTSDSLESLLPMAIFAGYLDILLTNFVGFSFVPIGLLLYLLPAAALNWISQDRPFKAIVFSFSLTKIAQRIAMLLVLTLSSIILIIEGMVWYADVLVSKAQIQLQFRGNLFESEKLLEQALVFNPMDADYHAQFARVKALIAVAFANAYQNPQAATIYKNQALKEANLSVSINPYREDLWREHALTLFTLKDLENGLLEKALDSMAKAMALYPNSPINYYSLFTILENSQQPSKARESLIKAIQLKPDFYEARFALVLHDYNQNHFAEGWKSLQALLELKPGKDQKKNLVELRSAIEKKNHQAAQLISDYLQTIP